MTSTVSNELCPHCRQPLTVETLGGFPAVTRISCDGRNCIATGELCDGATVVGGEAEAFAELEKIYGQWLAKEDARLERIRGDY